MKAPRDMTRAEFKKALARNGFHIVLLWMQDDTREHGTSYGMVMSTRGKVLYRASLAKALRERERDRRCLARGGAETAKVLERILEGTS